MKKRKQGRTLSRVRSQRIALLRTMATSLIMHKRITTTLAKAKELRPFVEKIATHAKQAKEGKELASVVRLLKRNLPAKAVHEVIELAEKFKHRKGGYLRIIKLDPRPSDGAEMALVEWVDADHDQKKQDKAKKASEKNDDKKGSVKQ